MSELSYTVIEESARAKFNISRDEYALCNYVQTWASWPGSRVPGYCCRTQAQIAKFIGITERGLRKMQIRMTEIGLLEPSPSGRFYRITTAWFTEVMLARQTRKAEQSSGFQEVQEPEQSSAQNRNKVPVKPELSSAKTGTKFLHIKRERDKELGKEIIQAQLTDEAPAPEPEKNETPPPVAPPPPAKKIEAAATVARVVDYLNRLTGTQYKATSKATAEMINARLAQGWTAEDIELVIAHKTHAWLNDPRMRQYLRPETLFALKHFESYLNAARMDLQKPQTQNLQHNGKITFEPAAAIRRGVELAERIRAERAAGGSI